jgi:hypothetical protein
MMRTHAKILATRWCFAEKRKSKIFEPSCRLLEPIDSILVASYIVCQKLYVSDTRSFKPEHFHVNMTSRASLNFD